MSCSRRMNDVRKNFRRDYCTVPYGGNETHHRSVESNTGQYSATVQYRMLGRNSARIRIVRSEHSAMGMFHTVISRHCRLKLANCGSNIRIYNACTVACTLPYTVQHVQ